MAVALALATLLGGVAAVWFFWDKIRVRSTEPVLPRADPAIVDVDLRYVEDSGLAPRLKSQGYRLQWATEDRLQRLLDLEGWELVVDTEPSGRLVRYRIRDPISNLHLIQKREKPTV